MSFLYKYIYIFFVLQQQQNLGFFIYFILQQQQNLGTGLRRKIPLNQNSTRYIINAASFRPTDLLVKTKD
jgi:hypothetical protein